MVKNFCRESQPFSRKSLKDDFVNDSSPEENPTLHRPTAARHRPELEKS